MVRKHSKHVSRRHSRRGLHEFALPPMVMSNLGSDFGDFGDSVFSMDSIKDLAILGAAGAGTIVASNISVNALGKIPTLGPYMKWLAPAVPIAAAFAAKKYLSEKYPNLAIAVAGAAVGSAIYAMLNNLGLFSAIGLSGLMGDDGLASDIYIPELVGLGAYTPQIPQQGVSYVGPAGYDQGVPATAFLGIPRGNGMSEIVDESSAFESDLLTSGQEEDENFEPTDQLTDWGNEGYQSAEETAADMLPI